MSSALTRRETAGTVPVRTRMAKVLIVEDDIDLQTALQVRLEGADMLVRSAGDGHRALELIRDFAPDIVVMDLGLPGIDGIDLLERLRVADGSRPSIIVLSAWDEGRCRQLTLDRGASIYLEKPVDLQELLTSIRFLLN